MNKEDAKKVLLIMAKADGGCAVCVERLYRKFLNDFPEHKDALIEVINDDKEHPLSGELIDWDNL